MSYGRDPDARMRGVGSIAAVDSVTQARARQQAAKERVMRAIDRRYAKVAHGPGRALPVPLSLGRVSNTKDMGQGGSPRNPPPRNPPPPPRPTPMPPTPRPPSPIAVVPVRVTGTLGPAPVRPTRPPITAPIIGTGPVRPTFPGSSQPTLPPLEPFPVSQPPVITKPPVVVTGGGGGAGVTPGQPTLPPLDHSIVEPLPMPDASGGGSEMSTNTKIALAIGGLGLLYLVTRNR